MSERNYKVPQFDVMTKYQSCHYEHVLIPYKQTESGNYLAAGNEFPKEIPVPAAGLFSNGVSLFIPGDKSMRLEFGKPHIFMFKMEGRNKDGKPWLVVDAALPLEHFKVHQIVQKAMDSWRFNFIKPKIKTLYEVYGEHSLMVINHNPEAAQEILQLTTDQWKRLNKELVHVQSAWHELRVLLRFGFDPKMANFIIDAYRGSDAVSMNKHPFRLAQKEGVNTAHLNRFFKAMGILSADEQLLENNLRDYLDAAVGVNGGTSIEIEEGITKISKSLGVDEDRVKDAIYKIVSTNQCDFRYLDDLNTISLGKSLRNDQNVARTIAGNIGPATHIPYRDYEGDSKPDGTNLELNQDQKTAIYLALNNRMSVITGGPGTGKTTTAKTLIREIKRNYPRGKVYLAAPTGKAARRLSEVTGLPCMTLHRMLGMVPGTSSMLSSFGEQDTLIIDEMSMVDLHLFATALRHIGRRGRVVLIGDSDQLPSVDSGDVLNDIINTRRVPVSKLIEVQRQAAESNIVTGSYSVLKGEMPDFSRDLHFVHVADSEDIVREVKRLVREVIPNELGIKKERIQILSAQKSNVCGINQINKEVKDIFNPSGYLSREHRQLGYTYYHIGDRVMYLKNRYDRDIQNGECGIIESFDEDNECLTINVEGKKVVVPYKDYQEMIHAWASTVHKSQGSEYDCIIFTVPKEHNFMLTRNLIFTAMTRGKRHVFFVGDQANLREVLKNNAPMKRKTHLSFLVAEATAENSEYDFIRRSARKPEVFSKEKLTLKKRVKDNGTIMKIKNHETGKEVNVKKAPPKRRYRSAAEIDVPF